MASLRSSAALLVACATAASGCGDTFSLDAGAGGAGSASGATTTSTSASSASGGGGEAATGTSSVTGTSSGTGGGGGGGPELERCANGLDDDANGLVDCDDPACDAFACVEPAPPSWSGPVAFYYGAPAPELACDAVWPTMKTAGGGTLAAAEPACSCSCSTPSGAACSLPAVTLYTDVACAVSIAVLANGGNNACQALANAPPMSLGAKGAAPSVSGGSCTAIPDHQIADPTYEFAAVLCEGAEVGGGCSNQQVCAPKVGAPFATHLCIYQEGGSFTCPAGMYSYPTYLQGDVDDTRACSDCTCNPPGGITCSGTTSLASDMVCAQTNATIPHDGSCAAIAPSFSSYVYKQVGPQGGSCSPLGGAASGTAVPSAPITVCCAR